MKIIVMRGVIVFMISCTWVLYIHAQDSYAWNQIEINPDSNIYEMYSFDFFSYNPKLMFTLTESRFNKLSKPKLKINRVFDFEFTADKQKVYFIQHFGDLFVYDIKEDKLEYLIDLTPETIPFPWIHIYTASRNLLAINDSMLYIGGITQSLYNIKSNTYQRLKEVSSVNESNLPNEQLISSVYMVKHKDKYIYTSGKQGCFGLADLNYPQNNSLLFDLGDCFVLNQLISHQFNCDSTQLYLFYEAISCINSPDNKIGWYVLDLNSGNITYSHPIFLDNNINSFSNFSFKHYNKTTYDDCQRYIDLDDNDNTAQEKNFLIDSLCSFSQLPLSDIDLKVRNEYPMDSIDIIIENEDVNQLSIPNGNYIIRPINDSLIRLVNNGTTTNLQLEDAIRNATLTVSNFNTLQELSIKFRAWYDSLAGPFATATIRLATPLPTSGDNIRHDFCIDSLNINLNLLPSPGADNGGMFYDEFSGEVNSLPVFTQEDSIKLAYVTDNGICHDTADINLYIHGLPVIDEINDSIICHDAILNVNLSAINDEIIWNDGSIDKIRNFTSSSSYGYTVKNDYNCETSDTFSLTVLPPPVAKPVEAKVCEGEKFIFLNREYNTAGMYAVTISNSLNCDSILFNIVLSFFAKNEIEIDGALDICEGNKSSLNITSDHSNITIDGISIDKKIELDKSGSYIIQAKDRNDCLVEKEIIITTYPSPEVITQDLLDTVFVDELTLPVQYNGDITSYTWTPSVFLDCDDCPNPTLVQKQEGIYQIIVQNDIGCSDSSEVKVSFKETKLYMPNVLNILSSNIENSTLYLKGNSKSTYSMSVYDRWGNKLFNGKNLEVNNADQGWKPSADISSGVFVYVVNYLENDKETYITGDVTLVR